MNKTIQFALMVAVIASVGLAATAVMSPLTAHAATSQWCDNQGDCFTSKQACLSASPGQSPCRHVVTH